MSQNVKYALVIIALAVIILVVNQGQVSVDLIITKVQNHGVFCLFGLYLAWRDNRNAVEVTN